MKKLLLILSTVIATYSNAQVEIYEVSSPSDILNATEVVVDGQPTDIATYIDLRVKNIGSDPIQVRFRRDRVIGNSAQDQICDNLLCYDCADAPTYTTPSATTLAENEDMIFKPQFVPDGNSFCAIHDYYIVDNLGFLLDSVRIKFRIGGEDCALDLVQVSQNSTEIAMYPNPSGGFVTIDGAVSGSTLKIIDILGQELKKVTLQSENETLNLTALPNGVYFCSVTLPNGESIPTKKLVLKD